MDVLLVIVVAVLVTGLTIALSRAGARRHQEDLNTHHEASSAEPVVDRPADAEAEPMGVEGPGDPTPRRETRPGPDA